MYSHVPDTKSNSSNIIRFIIWPDRHKLLETPWLLIQQLLDLFDSPWFMDFVVTVFPSSKAKYRQLESFNNNPKSILRNKRIRKRDLHVTSKEAHQKLKCNFRCQKIVFITAPQNLTILYNQCLPSSIMLKSDNMFHKSFSCIRQDSYIYKYLKGFSAIKCEL